MLLSWALLDRVIRCTGTVARYPQTVAVDITDAEVGLHHLF